MAILASTGILRRFARLVWGFGLAALLTACGGGGGGGQVDQPPSISNLRYSPATAVQSPNGKVDVVSTIDVADADGDIVSVRMVTNAGADLTVPASALAGVKSGTGSATFRLSVDQIGKYTFELWVVDSRGSASNRLSGQFEVTAGDSEVPWSRMTTNVTAQLSKVIWTGTQFVAVGSGGTILTSPDGSAWTKRDSGTGNNLTDVASSGTGLVAVGYQGTVVTSADGVTWIASGLPSLGAGMILQSIASSGQLFVAVGVNPYVSSASGGSVTIWSVDDGRTWTVEQDDFFELSAVSWIGSQFIAGGSPLQSAPPAVLHLSSDQRSIADVAVLNSDSFHATTAGFATNGTGASSTIVAVADRQALASVAGAPWQRVGTGTAFGSAVAWNGAQFLACGPGVCARSDDGLAWDIFALPNDAWILGLAWGGPGAGRWVAVGADGVILASP